jgi:hypothetical protein
MTTSRCLRARVAWLALLPLLAHAASSIPASGGARPREEQQPDPGAAVFCPLFGGNLDQCLGYLIQDEDQRSTTKAGGARG